MSDFREAPEINQEVMKYRIFIARRGKKQYSEAEYIDLVNRLGADDRKDAHSDFRNEFQATLNGSKPNPKKYTDMSNEYLQQTYNKVVPNNAVRQNTLNTQIRETFPKKTYDPQRRLNYVQETNSLIPAKPQRKNKDGGRKIRGKKRRTRRHHTSRRRRRRRRCASYTKKFY